MSQLLLSPGILDPSAPFPDVPPVIPCVLIPAVLTQVFQLFQSHVSLLPVSHVFLS